MTVPTVVVKLHYRLSTTLQISQALTVRSWSNPLILQTCLQLSPRFVLTWRKSQHVEVYFTHHQVLANTLDALRPAIAEQNEWRDASLRLARRRGYRHVE